MNNVPEILEGASSLSLLSGNRERDSSFLSRAKSRTVLFDRCLANGMRKFNNATATRKRSLSYETTLGKSAPQINRRAIGTPRRESLHRICVACERDSDCRLVS